MSSACSGLLKVFFFGFSGSLSKWLWNVLFYRSEINGFNAALLMVGTAATGVT
jgi:hypothetical protein